MPRFILVARGKVQKVGYRDLVQDAAIELGIKGCVENLKDGSVRIVCEGDEGALNEFVQRINVSRGLIHVTSLERVETGPSTGEFEFFEIKYGPLEEEIGERMATAVRYAEAMWQEMRDMRQELGQKIDTTRQELGQKIDTTRQELGQKIDSVAQKVDETRQELGMKIDCVGGKVDAVGQKVDVVGQKVDKVIEKVDVVSQEVSGLRRDVGRVFSSELAKVRLEVDELKRAVARLEAKVDSLSKR